MHWGVVEKVGWGAVLRPPRGDKVRGEANCVFQMKKKFDFLPLTHSELFIKMKGNSISDCDHFEVHNSSQRGGHCDHRTSGCKQSIATPLPLPVTAAVLSDMIKHTPYV